MPMRRFISSPMMLRHYCRCHACLFRQSQRRAACAMPTQRYYCHIIWFSAVYAHVIYWCFFLLHISAACWYAIYAMLPWRRADAAYARQRASVAVDYFRFSLIGCLVVIFCHYHYRLFLWFLHFHCLFHFLHFPIFAFDIFAMLRFVYFQFAAFDIFAAMLMFAFHWLLIDYLFLPLHAIIYFLAWWHWYFH